MGETMGEAFDQAVVNALQSYTQTGGVTPDELQGEARELYEQWRKAGRSEAEALDLVSRSGLLLPDGEIDLSRYYCSHGIEVAVADCYACQHFEEYTQVLVQCHAVPEPPEITAELPDWVAEGDVLIIDVQRAGHGIVDSFEMRVVLDGDRLVAEPMGFGAVEGVEPL